MDAHGQLLLSSCARWHTGWRHQGLGAHVPNGARRAAKIRVLAATLCGLPRPGARPPVGRPCLFSAHDATPCTDQASGGVGLRRAAPGGAGGLGLEKRRQAAEKSAPGKEKRNAGSIDNVTTADVPALRQPERQSEQCSARQTFARPQDRGFLYLRC